MKLTYTLILIAAAAPAMAHPSHVVKTAGHDHIVAALAISVAFAVALIAGLKARFTAKQAA